MEFRSFQSIFATLPNDVLSTGSDFLNITVPIHRVSKQRIRRQRFMRPLKFLYCQSIRQRSRIPYFQTIAEYYVVKFTVPKKFVGYFVNELNLDEEFHLKLIGLKRADKVTNCLGISLMELHVKNELPGDEKVEEGDELVCYGKYRDFQSFWKAI